MKVGGGDLQENFGGFISILFGKLGGGWEKRKEGRKEGRKDMGNRGRRRKKKVHGTAEGLSPSLREVVGGGGGGGGGEGGGGGPLSLLLSLSLPPSSLSLLVVVMREAPGNWPILSWGGSGERRRKRRQRERKKGRGRERERGRNLDTPQGSWRGKRRKGTNIPQNFA